MALLEIGVHHYFHADPGEAASTAAILAAINSLKETIMSTQAETLVEIQALTAQVVKIKAEVETQAAAVEAALAAAGMTDPAVTQALADLRAVVQATDDVNPDAVAA